ncbi:MAG: hypothetical protein JO307_17120 [Bryobacterales bacterium]|nr:hypothetical protein [Bryobacterales bacterium]MBV9398143.1 hypothetical protein [Bryobacterales bacterium]
MHTVSKRAMIWRVSLTRIEQIVSAHLGPGRVPGNAQGPCFSRQVSMYLAKHVGHWGLSQIGKFYNGRHHTTVVHAIAKIENFRKMDESMDALIEVIMDELAARAHESPPRLPEFTQAALVEAVTTRVMDRLAELHVVNPGLDNRLIKIPAEG